MLCCRCAAQGVHWLPSLRVYAWPQAYPSCGNVCSDLLASTGTNLLLHRSSAERAQGGQSVTVNFIGTPIGLAACIRVVSYCIPGSSTSGCTEHRNDMSACVSLLHPSEPPS